MRSIAGFISSHGFGHAARACAVMEALRDHRPGLSIELFTAVPEWFFRDSLGGGFRHHGDAVDLGLVQTDALNEDLPATVAALRGFFPFDPARVEALAAAVTDAGCGLVLCDVAPLGIAVARRAGVPSVLLENFTWDWIYGGYRDRVPELGEVADRMAETFADADLRVQTEPWCRRVEGARRVPPVSRRPRLDRRAVRERLGVPETAPLVLVTMGGIRWDYAGLEARLGGVGGGDADGDGAWLVIPGAADKPRRYGRAVCLPHRSGFHHPDLVAAADAVVGKLGYSTLAEVHRAGVPYGYVPRPGFPESEVLEAWVRAHLLHRRIPGESFVAGRWLDDLEPLLDLPRRPPPTADGADHAARLALDLAGEAR